MLKRRFLSALYFLSIALGVGHKIVDIISTPLLYPLPHNINQSETGIGDKNLSVELLSIFFRKPITQSTHYLL